MTAFDDGIPRLERVDRPLFQVIRSMTHLMMPLLLPQPPPPRPIDSGKGRRCRRRFRRRRRLRNIMPPQSTARRWQLAAPTRTLQRGGRRRGIRRCNALDVRETYHTAAAATGTGTDTGTGMAPREEPCQSRPCPRRRHGMLRLFMDGFPSLLLCRQRPRQEYPGKTLSLSLRNSVLCYDDVVSRESPFPFLIFISSVVGERETLLNRMVCTYLVSARASFARDGGFGGS
jgi:hypothetical protein